MDYNKSLAIRGFTSKYTGYLSHSCPYQTIYKQHIKQPVLQWPFQEPKLEVPTTHTYMYIYIYIYNKAYIRPM